MRIPKLYNGKNKFFFYFEYDKITNIQANPNTPIFTMPTAAERSRRFFCAASPCPMRVTTLFTIRGPAAW